MRKLISFGLLFLFLWQIGGYLIEFQCETSRIRKEIKKLTKEAVPRNQLVHFRFSQEEINALTWVKIHEFRLKGHFYDVVWRKKLENGKIELQCVSDDQETVLFEKLDQYVSANLANQNPDKPLKNWSKIFFGNYLPCETFPNAIWEDYFVDIKESDFLYRSSFSELHAFIETPPPNALLA